MMGKLSLLLHILIMSSASRPARAVVGTLGAAEISSDVQYTRVWANVGGSKENRMCYKTVGVGKKGGECLFGGDIARYCW